MNNLKKVPMRKCTGCNELKEKKDLIRIVKTKEDDFFVDTTGRANGRGAYLCDRRECLSKAIKNKGLERSLKCKLPADIFEKLEEEISNE